MNFYSALKPIILVAVVAAALTRGASATDIPVVWDGDTDTVWNNGLNWVGNAAPPAVDHAKFTGTFANQPTLTGAESVGGVWITGLGQDLATGLNDNVLTIGGNTINGIPGVAVLFQNTTGFNAAINNKISIASAGLAIRNDTDQALIFSAFTGNDVVIELNANTLTFSNNGAGSITTNVIGGTGGVTIDSAGTGPVISSDNATSFSGQLTVARGILQLNSFNDNATNGKLGNNSLPVILGSSGNTGTLLWLATATDTSTKKFTLATGGTGGIDLQPTTARTLTLSGLINGDGALKVQGNANGTLVLSGANTYSGGTTLASGTLSLGVNTSGSITNGPVGTGTLTLSGGNLTATAARTIANPIHVAASTTSNIFGSAGNITLTGAWTGSGTIDNSLDTTNVARSIAINGDISGFSGTIIHDRAAPSVSTVGTDTYRFNGTTPQSQDGSQARFVLNGSADTSLTGTIFRIVTQNNGIFKMGELSGNGNYIRNDLNGSIAGQQMTLEVGHLGNASTVSSWGGVYAEQPNTTSNFTKVGAGKLTLTGTNSYTGVTTVSGGTLLVNGNPTGGGAYSVASGATLGGTGTIGSSVGISSGGTLSPGASIGTFTVGSADIDGKLLVEYSGDLGTIDKLIVTGALDITNTLLDFDNLGSAALSGGPYVFATYGSLIGGAFAGPLDVPAGFIINYNYLGGNQIALVGNMAHAGDFDGDGDVDGADFVAWQTNFPTSMGATLAQGDADADADVDGADFVVWQTNFPFTPGPGTAPVPEPTAGCLLLLGSLLAGAGVWKRARSVGEPRDAIGR